MGEYKHGVYGSEVPTSLIPMTEVSAGLPVVFGTAPIHKALAPAKPNTPILCYTYAEAVKQLGYSDDWEKYTLCEFMKSHFALFNMAPVVFVNVLDPSTHKTNVADTALTLTKGSVTLDASETIVLSTLVVKAVTAGQPLLLNTDYTASYNSDGRLVITAIPTGALSVSTTIYATYDKVDASAVKASDIVGGINPTTGAKKGLELVSQIFPRFRLVPGMLLAPGWSEDVTVAAVLKAKCKNINGCFEAIALTDIPTTKAKLSQDVAAYINNNNIIDPYVVACWPLVSLGGVKYHLSTQLAGDMCRTDSVNDDVPYWSPSNQSIQADSTVLADGTEVLLDNSEAAYLNGQGIVTAINYIGGWKAWGNRTTAYPGTTDVKDTFIPIRRMFNWVNNTLITTFWSKIDNPINKRLINTIVDSANIWLNGLTAKGYILGGRVEIHSDENTTTDLMDGKIVFHVYLTPPSPAREIEFTQEYDPEYLSGLFTE